MNGRLLLFLLGLAVFLPSLLIQLPLCALAKGIARLAGLLFPAGWFLAALWALGADKSHSFIRLGPTVAAWLAAMGLLSLTGYGAAWFLYRLYQRKKK